MIYTLTVNPALDYNIFSNNISLGSVNRANDTDITFGGKGINVSCVLKELGVYSTAMGFAAGFTGQELLTRLCKANIITDFVRLKKGLTRINVKLHTGEDTDINAGGPEIDAAATQELYKKLSLLQSGDYLCLSGSIPEGHPELSYEKIMETLQNSGINFVVDAEGETLLKTLKYKPFLVKPNHKELGGMFGVDINDIESAISYGRRLIDMGALNVLVSMGAKGAVLITEDVAYFAAAPKGQAVNAVGSGDSSVAGFLAEYINTGSYVDALCMAVAAGSATAFTRGLAQGKQIVELSKKIIVEEKEK